MSLIEKAVDRFAHSRATVLKAIHKRPGMTYIQIRDYITWHFHFTMENVGARCRELSVKDWAAKRVGDKGRVHVYPMEGEK